MADAFKARTMKRKNVKGLALSAPQPRNLEPSAGDSQIPGGIGNDEGRADTLEIGVEFRLDLKAEDLIVLKELGSGNGGTVSKVQHAATKVIMARKVWLDVLSASIKASAHRLNRSSTSRRKMRCGNASFGNSGSCTTATPSI
jgi:hypothetical protein